MLKRTLPGLLLLVVLVGGACQRDGSAQADFDTSEEDIPMRLTVELRGDLEVTVTKRTVPTKVIVIQGAVPGELHALGIEAVDPITEGPVRVRPGFALVPFQGDGRYTIRAGSPFDAQKDEEEAKRTGKPREQSSVRVEWWPADREPEFYVRREKPCTAKVDDGGMKGRIQCPQMTQEGSGRRFSLDFRWERP